MKYKNFYQNVPTFNGAYPRDNQPDKIKVRAYFINLDGSFDIETHWIALYALNDNAYFDSLV